MHQHAVGFNTVILNYIPIEIYYNIMLYKMSSCDDVNINILLLIFLFIIYYDIIMISLLILLLYIVI